MCKTKPRQEKRDAAKAARKIKMGEVYFGEVDVRRFDRMEQLFIEMIDKLEAIRCNIIDVESAIEHLKEQPASLKLSCHNEFHNRKQEPDETCPECKCPF